MFYKTIPNSSILICCITFCLFMLCVFGCSKKPDSKSSGIAKTPADSFYLSKDDLEELSSQAEKGDGNAAFRLFQYYELSLYDYEKSFFWLKKAAENGHTIAQYNLALTFLDDKERKDTNKAIYWLRKAAQGGHSTAKELLEKMERKK